MADKDNLIVQPTDQIEYRWREGILLIDDPRVKAVAGFVPEDFSFKDGLALAGIRINAPPGMPFVIPGERYAVIGLVSLDGKALNESADIILSAMSTSFNSGLAIDPIRMSADTEYALGLARSITNRGGLPVLTSRVGLTLRADWLSGRRYRMMDYNDRILEEGTATGQTLTIPPGKPVYLVRITRDDIGE